MTKRAHSLLFTLFFLLLGTTTAWGQQYAEGVVVAGTDFNSKTGNYPCSLNDIIYFGEEALSTSFTQASGTNPGEGKYSITADGFYIGKKGNVNNPAIFTHNIQGLLTVTNHNDYIIRVHMKAIGNQVQMQWKITTNGNDSYHQFQVNPSDGNVVKELTFTTTSGAYSYSLQRQGGDGTLLITRIEVIGDTEPKITSSLGFGVCAGETTTLQVIGHSGAIQWQVSENPSGPWTNVQNATSAKLDVQVTKNQYYKVGNIVSRRLTPTMCCAYEANPNYIAEIRFDMGTPSTTPQRLPQGGSIYTNNTDGTGYKFYTEGSESTKIEDGEYAVVHKAPDGGYWNGQNDLLSDICGKDYNSDRNDGFLLVNCNPKNTGKPMYEQVVGGLCDNAMHNFSISVVSVDVDPSHEGIAVKMQVYAMPSETPLLVDPIIIRKNCGEGWGEPYSASITTPSGCTEVKISIINANTSGIAAGNDVGIDDILFSRCNPELALFADADRSTTQLKYCPNDQTASLYVGEPANLDIIFPNGKWYYYQEKKADGTWGSLGAAVPNNTFAVSPTVATTYRVTVAGTQELAEDAGNGTLGSSLGCNSFATSNEVTITPECNCQTSTAPTTNPYNECPSETKLDLNTRIDNPSATGKYYWYTTATGGSPMSASEAQNIDVSQYNAANPTRTYYVSYDQDGDTETYCESERTAVTVTVKPIITFDFDKTSITGCATAYASETSRTISVINLTPGLQGIDYTWSDTNTGSGAATRNATYIVPTLGAGTVTLKITASNACDSQETDQVTYSLNEQTTITNISASPNTVCVSNPASTLSATVSPAAGTYNWYKNNNMTTPVATGTVPADGIVTYSDAQVANTPGSATYTLVVGDPANCGAQASTTVQVATEMEYTMYATQNNTQVTTICQDTEVTIHSGVTNFDNTTQTITWYSDAAKTQEITDAKNKVEYTINNLTQQSSFYISVEGGTCNGSGQFTLNVNTRPVVVIALTRDNICHGDTSTVQIDFSDPTVVIPAGSTFAWKGTYTTDTSTPDNPYTNFNTTSATGLKQHTFAQAGNYKFELTVANGENCDATSNLINFWVAGAPQFTVNAQPADICQNNPTNLSLTMATDKVDNVTEMKWTLNGSEVTGAMTESTQGSNTIFTLEVTPDQAGKLTYQADVTALCSASKTVEVTVEKGIEATLNTEFEICEGDTVTLAVNTKSTDYRYTWSPYNGLSSNTDRNPIASPSKTMDYVVRIETAQKTCTLDLPTTVKVHPLPQIVSIEETGIRQITAEANSETQWATFRVDDKEDVYENSPVVISNIPIGYHRLYITNEFGCENSQQFEISPVPIKPRKFFTPNDEGDPEYNFWKVEGLNAYTSWIVEIFDRYGRRIYEYRTGSFSQEGNSGSEEFIWDGMYNGHQMPSDDYWYLITVEEIRKQYTGHFTLKR